MDYFLDSKSKENQWETYPITKKQLKNVKNRKLEEIKLKLKKTSGVL